MGYITPNTVPSASRLARFLIPDDPAFIAAVHGALMELTRAKNWEMWTGITEQQAAELAWESYLTLQLDGEESMPFIGVKARSTVNQLTQTGVPYALYFDTVDYDTGGMHDPLQTRWLTIPEDGYYHLSAALEWPYQPNGVREIWISRPDTGETLAKDSQPAGPETPNGIRQYCATDAYLVAGEKIQLIAYQNRGANNNIRANETSPILMVAKIGE